jgi:uncharacterized protein with HEPN domain
MSQRDELVYLHDMVTSARRILEYLEGRSRTDLDKDQMLQDAVCRQLEVLGEAANRVGEGTRSKHPSLPWKSIIGMRNQLIHAYHRVDLDIVWQTAEESLPELIQQLEALLKDGG